MNFEDQVIDLTIIRDSYPRIHLRWTNTESGRDKNESYEVVMENGKVQCFINNYNTNQIVGKSNKFFYQLEKMYLDTLNSKQITMIDLIGYLNTNKKVFYLLNEQWIEVKIVGLDLNEEKVKIEIMNEDNQSSTHWTELYFRLNPKQPKYYKFKVA